MPPSQEPSQKQMSPGLSAQRPEDFPDHAFEFVHEGLDFTVHQAHGPGKEGQPDMTRHVSGQQLCEGLRELALAKWGRMARTVLRRWNIQCTYDFGRIVYTQIDTGHMQKVDEDSIDDFRDVYDFESAFESTYRIPSQP